MAPDLGTQVVHRMASLVYMKDRVVLVGDGMKHAKEGRRISDVKKLQPASGNSSKSEYIFGHLFGAAISMLVGMPLKWFRCPCA
jgi:hypothetical protein